MMTVNEMSKLTGVSIRTLQYYDKIGLLPPTTYSDAGYRLYDDYKLEKLQQIMLLKELEFSLKEIQEIISSPTYDKNKALKQQIELLTLKKEHLEKLINFAIQLKEEGEMIMDFEVFNKEKIENYAKEAKKQWGHTEAYKEHEEKFKNYTQDEQEIIHKNFMEIFKEFGAIKDQAPENDIVQEKVNKLQNYITNHYYTCTNTILSELGKMYGAGGEFTTNIDKVAGEGTADFVSEAISIYCSNNE